MILQPLQKNNNNALMFASNFGMQSQSDTEELLLEIELKLKAISYLMSQQTQPTVQDTEMQEIWLGLSFLLDTIRYDLQKVSLQLATRD